MRIFTAVLLVAFAMGAVPGTAAGLEEKQALAKAVEILKGDPYGETAAQVAANIKERRRAPRRDTVCGGGAAQAWAFHVVVAHAPGQDGPIDGWLVIDASSGKTVCATLPFLD